MRPSRAQSTSGRSHAVRPELARVRQIAIDRPAAPQPVVGGLPGGVGLSPLLGTVLARGRVRAQELHPGQTGMEVAQAVGHHLVAHVAREVDHEAVVAETLLGRARLELGQVDVARRELAEDAVQAARGGRPAGSTRCSSCRGRWAWAPGSGPQHEPGLVVRMVLDVLGEDRPGRSARRPAAARWRRRRATATRRAAGPRRPWSWRPAARRRAASGPGTSGTGPGRGGTTTRADVGRARCPAGHEVEVDVHHDLPLDMQVDIVDQPVDGGADRALDGVLDGHEPAGRRRPGRRPRAPR